MTYHESETRPSEAPLIVISGLFSTIEIWRNGEMRGLPKTAIIFNRAAIALTELELKVKALNMTVADWQSRAARAEKNWHAAQDQIYAMRSQVDAANKLTAENDANKEALLDCAKEIVMLTRERDLFLQALLIERNERAQAAMRAEPPAQAPAQRLYTQAQLDQETVVLKSMLTASNNVGRYLQDKLDQIKKVIS